METSFIFDLFIAISPNYISFIRLLISSIADYYSGSIIANPVES